MPNKKNENIQRQIFLPGMSWWVAVLVFAIIFLFILGIPFYIWSINNIYERLFAALVIVFLILYIVDSAFFTNYELTPDHLLINSQFRLLIIPYRDIRELKKGNLLGLFSFGKRKRFALSSNCLYLYISNSPWELISLSPKNQTDFTEQLLQHIDRERDSRATIIKRKTHDQNQKK